MIAQPVDRPALRKRQHCRACDSTELEKFLELGPMPLANAFLRSVEEFSAEAKYPLDVYFCPECSLVQLLDVVDPEVLFREYIYVSGTSDTIAAHYQTYAAAVIERLGLTRADRVIEVASNDGSLLQCFIDRGVQALGVEPASNIARTAVERGRPTVNAFFNHATAQAIAQDHGKARAVIANNVLAHVDDTRDFLRGCSAVLQPDGLVVIEVPYLGKLLDHLEYDTIYHEHLCYFSVSALLRLFASAELSVVQIDHVSVHGGSLRIFAGHRRANPEHSRAVRALAEGEAARGITLRETYQRFARDVRDSREALREMLQQLNSDQKLVAGYGAPAKGNTLLNYCGIDTHLLPFTFDKNPLKVGRYTPGTHVPVLAVSEIAARRPDYLLILAWNFADEIIRQQAEFQARGGRFILPIPSARIV